MFHREGDCFTPCFLKRLQQSTEAPAIKPSPGPACPQQGLTAPQEALPGYCSPTFTLHFVLQSGEGWAKYLLVFLLPLKKNKTKYKFTQKNLPRISNLRRAISITFYIITSNLFTADYKVFFNHSKKTKLLLPPRNTAHHHLFLHLQSVLFTNIYICP